MPEPPEWMTWPEAAELVGCPVSTIDYNQRIGRIEGRRERPTLRRTSVEAFAVWWREREDRYARQRAAPPRDAPPDSVGWITSEEAAERLDRSLGDVRRLVREGKVDGLLRGRGRRLWIREADVDRVAAGHGQWVSIKTAATMLGWTPKVVRRWAEAGRFERRSGVGRASPSISRASVEKLAAELGGTVGGTD